MTPDALDQRNGCATPLGDQAGHAVNELVVSHGCVSSGSRSPFATMAPVLIPPPAGQVLACSACANGSPTAPLSSGRSCITAPLVPQLSGAERGFAARPDIRWVGCCGYWDRLKQVGVTGVPTETTVVHREAPDLR